MANYDDKKSKPQITRELFRRWRDGREQWDAEARNAVDFTLGNHYSTDESDAWQWRGTRQMWRHD